MLKDKEYYDSLTHTLLKEQPFLNQTDLAYELVLREILNGQLSPGEKIPQEQLAVLFGMSRTPVRDALIRLEEDRFLEKSGRAGYQVSRIRLKDYVDFCEFRLMLEAKAAYLAARNITGKHLEQLRENMERFREAADGKELRSILLLDKEFHDIIAQASDNFYICEALGRYRSRELLNLQLSLKEESIRFVLDKHQAIYDAICAHNEELAEKSMTSHLKFYMKNIYYVYD